MDEKCCGNCYRRVVLGTHCFPVDGVSFCSEWLPITDLHRQLKAIPTLGAVFEANRYDTDDMMVLHVWDNDGHSYDIMCPKAPKPTEEPSNFGDCHECMHYPERARDEPCASCKVGSAWVQAPKPGPCPECGATWELCHKGPHVKCCPDCYHFGEPTEKPEEAKKHG